MLAENSIKTLAMATLCCRIGGSSAINPKTWLELEARLEMAGHCDASVLFKMSKADFEQIGFSQSVALRLESILKTAPLVLKKLKELVHQGVKIITIYNPDYPQYLMRKMGVNAPSVLFCIGNLALFNTKGVSITGSRDLDENSADFAKQIGILAAKEGYTLISGGAKGADSIGEDATLNNGGTALLYLSHGLFEKAKESFEHIEKGNLLLCVAHNPYARFEAYNALGRNEYIYKSARACFVAHSRYGRGGTFSGAKKNIKDGGPPTYLFAQSEGNRALCEMGGIPLETPPETLSKITPFA